MLHPASLGNKSNLISMLIFINQFLGRCLWKGAYIHQISNFRRCRSFQSSVGKGHLLNIHQMANFRRYKSFKFTLGKEHSFNIQQITNF
mmetsp:Transcript_23894/g.36319  ORF Transcript_23894/g.36319 Transcript_23894/m.36319 type:complete len:89 (-) Transcript_23894:1299-1565(-)